LWFLNIIKLNIGKARYYLFSLFYLIISSAQIGKITVWGRGKVKNKKKIVPISVYYTLETNKLVGELLNILKKEEELPNSSTEFSDHKILG